METEYSYLPPEEIQRHIDGATAATEHDYWRDIEANLQDHGTPWGYTVETTDQGVGVQSPAKESREAYDAFWNARKKHSEFKNLHGGEGTAGLNGIYHGTMYILGRGMPRG